jgi:hypothetical protein
LIPNYFRNFRARGKDTGGTCPVQSCCLTPTEFGASENSVSTLRFENQFCCQGGGGQIMPTTLLCAPRIFLPSYSPVFYHNVLFVFQGGSSITFMITMKRLIITEFLTTMLPTILIVLVRKSIVYSCNYI